MLASEVHIASKTFLNIFFINVLLYIIITCISYININDKKSFIQECEV